VAAQHAPVRCRLGLQPPPMPGPEDPVCIEKCKSTMTLFARDLLLELYPIVSLHGSWVLAKLNSDADLQSLLLSTTTLNKQKLVWVGDPRAATRTFRVTARACFTEVHEVRTAMGQLGTVHSFEEIPLFDSICNKTASRVFKAVLTANEENTQFPIFIPVDASAIRVILMSACWGCGASDHIRKDCPKENPPVEATRNEEEPPTVTEITEEETPTPV
ncbi:hypothetical protein IWQ62_003448, partial [Dispira parvispora]